MAADQPLIKLAVDLDGVMTEHPASLARAANDHFNLILPDSAFVDSAGHAVTQTVRDWVYGRGGPAETLRVNPMARDFLRRVVARLGAENVRVVTARPASSVDVTRAWLAQHHLDLCEVIFADDKVRVAHDLGITHAVEDSIRHATAYGRAGVTCYLITGHADALIKGVEHPVHDLAEAAARILDDHSALTPAPRPTIVIADAIAPSARAMLGVSADLVDVLGTDVPALLAAVVEADALVVRSETQVNADVFAAAPRLRVVARAGVGVDNIDVEAATRAGVLVLNAPGANAISAGEHTIALLLAISRQLIDANSTLHAGRWERKRFAPFDLRGKTIGIVGLGRVGSIVATRLRAFETCLIGYDPYITAERFSELGVAPTSYTELLRACDIVTFHVPSTAETRDMLGAATLPLLKRGAIVLNAARGDVVDEQALALALQSGHVAAAGVDVFPAEPVTASPLWGLPNVVLTPHIGGSSVEALAAVGDVIARTTLAALRGEAVPNAVNLPAAAVDSADLERLTRVAGAAGHLLGVLDAERPREFSMTVRGNLPAEAVEHVFVAALSEGLRRWTNARVTPVNARLIAEEHGLALRVAHAEEHGPALPAGGARFSFESRGDIEHLVSVRWEHGLAGIVEVDRFSLDRPLVGDVLITHHRDRPGLIGRVGMILGSYDVNVAGMQVGRHHRGGEALMVLSVDDAIPPSALLEILAIEDVNTAYVVSLPTSEPATNGIRHDSPTMVST